MNQIRKLFVLVLPIVCGLASMAQTNELIITGKFKIDGGSNKDATITLEKDGRKVKTIAGESRFEVGLDFQAIYIVSFEKEGFVTKRIRFDTHVPPERIEYGFVPFDFTVEIFEQFDDVNVVMFNQPVGKIAFSDLIDEFDYDTDYTQSIQARLDDVMEEIEEKKEEKAAEEAAALEAEQELIDQIADLKEDAQKAMDNSSPEEAIKMLEEAAKLKDDPEIQQLLNQANDLNAKLAEEKKQQAAAEGLIDQANAALANGDLEGAKKKFEEAAGLLSGDKRIEAGLADVNKQIQDKADAEAELNDLVKQAQDALANGDYDKAIDLANSALEIDPNGAAGAIVSEATDKKAEQEAQAEAEKELNDKIEQLNKEADDLIESEDYPNAIAKLEELKTLQDSPEVNEKLQNVLSAKAKKEEEAEQEAAQQEKVQALISEATQALESGSIDEARAKAAEAKAIDAEAVAALENSIADAEKAIADKEAEQLKQDEKFEALLNEANEALSSGEVDAASEKVAEALQMKPESEEALSLNQLIEQKRDEIATQAAAEAEAAQAEEAKKAQFEALLDEADAALASGDYDAAKGAYTKAGELFEDKRVEKGLQDVESKISELSAAEAESAKQAEFDELLAEADAALANGELEAAKTAYTKAGELFEDKRVTKGLKTIEDQIAQKAAAENESAQQEADYAQAVNLGDAAMNEDRLDDAESEYLKAQKLFDRPEIEEKLEQLENRREELVQNAAKEEATKAEEEAKKNEEEAARLAQEEKEKAAAKANEEQAAKQIEYDGLVASGDESIAAANYKEALKDYNKAKAVLETPEIEEKIAEAMRLEEEALAAAKAGEASKAEEEAKAKRLEEQQQLIESANKKFGKDNLDDAEKDLLAALEIGEDPRINDLQKQIADRRTELASEANSVKDAQNAEEQKKERDKRFEDLIKSGDKKIKSEELQEALSDFNAALSIKPEETYPQEKIQEIEQRLAEIASENELQSQQEEEARMKAEQAKLEAERLKAEEAELADAERLKAQEKNKKEDEEAARIKEQEDAKKQEAELNEAISRGDAMVKNGKFRPAIEEYQKAQNIRFQESVDDKIAQAKALLTKQQEERRKAKEAAQAMSNGAKESNELANIIQEESEKQSTNSPKSPDIDVNPNKGITQASGIMEVDEKPMKAVKGGAVALSEPRVGSEAMNSPGAQMSEDDIYDGVLEKVEKEQKQMVFEEEQRRLKEKYPRRKTIETEKEGTSTITYVYINRGDFVNVYKKVEHTWGGVFYFIDGQATNARFWVHETQ